MGGTETESLFTLHWFPAYFSSGKEANVTLISIWLNSFEQKKNKSVKTHSLGVWIVQFLWDTDLINKTMFHGDPFLSITELPATQLEYQVFLLTELVASISWLAVPNMHGMYPRWMLQFAKWLCFQLQISPTSDIICTEWLRILGAFSSSDELTRLVAISLP